MCKWQYLTLFGLWCYRRFSSLKLEPMEVVVADLHEFPEIGVIDHTQALKELRSVSSLYQKRKVPSCYPGTLLEWDPEILAEAARILDLQNNNIGTHTHNSDGETGFDKTHDYERDAVWLTASLVGGAPKTVDGYFCGGATEANQMGLWIGRQWLRQHPDPFDRGICILCTPLTHYSLHKASDILDIGTSSWSKCCMCHYDHQFVPDRSGAGVTFVGINERGEMSMDELRRVFKLKYEEGFRNFMIVPTIGTTILGSIDPVCEIAEFVRQQQRERLAYSYIHVDAAFGGFTVPFVDPDLKFGFEIPEVMSIAFDGDKMMRLPYPAGIFLCRKDLQRLIARKVGYIGGNEDDTLSGSRSALAPVMASVLFRLWGRKGQREYVKKCLDARDRLAELIRIRLPWATVFPFSPSVNLLPVEFRFDETNDEIPKEFLDDKGLLEGYHLRKDFFPSNPTDPQSCPRIVYKLCIMPHLIPHLETFIEDMAAAKRLWDSRKD